jgi:hypothetical protein
MGSVVMAVSAMHGRDGGADNFHVKVANLPPWSWLSLQ